jgi:hypothetical protein
VQTSICLTSDFLLFGYQLTNVVDYSDRVVELWWLEVLMVVDVVDVVGF